MAKSDAPKKHAIRRLTALAYETPWAITRAKLDAIVDLLDRRGQGHLDEAEIRSRLAGLQRRIVFEEGDDKPYRLLDGGIAVISLYGVLAPRMNWMVDFSGGTSTQEFADAVAKAADDDEVQAIVLDVDSPGGSVLGTAEAAEIVAAAADRKPVITVATGQMCSAAYWIGAAAGEIVASPSSQLGSIGVYQIHSDYSAADTTAGIRRTVVHAGSRKTIGNPHETLNQAGADELRGEVQDYYAMFVEAVARYRGASVAEVEANFGQGASMVAAKAVAAGLVDRIGTLSEVITELGSDRPPASAGGNAARQAARVVSNPQQEDHTVDPKILARLRALNLIAADADEKAARVALASWFAARGEGVPATPEATLAGLEERKALAAIAAPLVATPADPAAASSDAAGGAHARAAMLAERQRVQDIQARGELLGVDSAAIRAAVETGTSVADFLVQSTRDAAQIRPPVRRVEGGLASQDKWQETAIEALCRRHRIGQYGSSGAKPAEGAVRTLQYAPTMDIVRESLRLSCGRAVVGSPEQLAQAALGDIEMLHLLGAAGPGYATPGDFPNILAGLGSRTLEATPRFQGTTFQLWTWQRPSVPDFRPATLLRIGEFSELPLHTDGEDFEQSTALEEFSWLAVESFGDEFALTPVMVANDDLGAFPQALRDKDAAHDQTLNRLCVNILTSNPTMPDGNALFDDTNHGNDINAAASGGAPSVAELGLIRQRLRKQTGVSAKRKLNLTLAGLLIPEDIETTTEQLLNPTMTMVPTTDATVNTFRGRVAYWVEPMLADWSTVFYWGFAEASVARSIVHAYQTGYERMVTRNYFDNRKNARVWQFEGRFAAAANTWRGVVRDAGS